MSATNPQHELTNLIATIKRGERLWSLVKRLRLPGHRAKTSARIGPDLAAVHDARTEVEQELPAWSTGS